MFNNNNYLTRIKKLIRTNLVNCTLKTKKKNVKLFLAEQLR